jgi:hypothetical protein
MARTDTHTARRRRTARAALAASLSLAGLALGACGASAKTALSTSAPAPASTAAVGTPTASIVAEAPCGAAAGQTAAAAVIGPAERIYRLELASAEVRADKRQVESYAPLLSALASANNAGVKQAVTTLVYSHTHIVRLRVTRGAAVLADVGGPYIIAPVSGTLRHGGHVIGSYVLSVQDDVGYVKLETRYIGLPLLLRGASGRIPVEGMIPAAGIPDSGTLTYHGARVQAVSFSAKAFPHGPLRVTLLVPVPSGSLGCGAIRLQETGRIVQTMWRRFQSVTGSQAAFVKSAGDLTGALVYVRSGSHQLAGTTSPGPPKLPASGTVAYRGVTYRVTSFTGGTAAGPVTVYVLSH